jgi:disulfide oxidoreductase YuzD
MKYGQSVRVEYIDLADPENQARFPELLAVAEDRNLPYPLVAVNGQLKLAGTAHYYRVLPHVQELLQVEQN